MTSARLVCNACCTAMHALHVIVATEMVSVVRLQPPFLGTHRHNGIGVQSRVTGVVVHLDVIQVDRLRDPWTAGLIGIC